MPQTLLANRDFIQWVVSLIHTCSKAWNTMTLILKLPAPVEVEALGICLELAEEQTDVGWTKRP